MFIRVMYLSTALCLLHGGPQINPQINAQLSANQSRFLSNAAAARLPAQQPKYRSASGARDRYVVLGSIYYDLGQFISLFYLSRHLWNLYITIFRMKMDEIFIMRRGPGVVVV